MAVLNLIGLILNVIGGVLLALAVTIQPSTFKLVDVAPVQGKPAFEICHNGKLIQGGYGGPFVEAGDCSAVDLNKTGPTAELVADRPLFFNAGLVLIIGGFVLQLPLAFGAMKEKN
jgi:hypothetical protein